MPPNPVTNPSINSSIASPAGEGKDDEIDYVYTTPTHEPPPEGGAAAAMYALEGGDPDQEVDVYREEGGSQAWFNFRTFLSYCGPGFLMCIAYLDPGNLEADLQVGAYTGYSLIWVLFFATLMGLALQCMAARLGIVTGKNLARVCRDNYSRTTSLILWVLIEVAIIGSDLQEIIGSAIAFQVLFGLPLWIGCLITFIDTFTFLGIHYFGVRKLESLFVMLVSIMTICFFINFGKSPPPSRDIAEGFIPTIKPYAVMSAVGLIGAVIMPHNIYLHSALVLSRKIDRHSRHQVHEANKYFAVDSSIALLVSFVINLAVVSVFSYHFFDPQCASSPGQPLACVTRDAGSGLCVCQEIGLAHADDALAGALGRSAKYVWGVGLLAAGQASTMTGTYAGQYVMEGFLNLKVPVYVRVTFTRFVAIGPGLLVAILTQDNQSLSDRFQEWINVLQSIQLAFALLPVLHFTSSRRIMGEFVSGTFMTVSIWVLAFAVLAINIYLVIERIGGGQPWWVYLAAVIIGILYLTFNWILVYDDIVAGYNAVIGCLPTSMREWVEKKRKKVSSTNMQNPLIDGKEGDEQDDLIDEAKSRQVI